MSEIITDKTNQPNNQEPQNNIQQAPVDSTQSQTPEVPSNQGISQSDRSIAALGYLIFFLPLVIEPKTEFKFFHANQSLLLLIFTVIGNLLASFLTIILIGLILFPIVNVLAFILFILGIVNAFNGEKKRLPVIGNFDLLKF